MKYINIGNSGLMGSEIALGCMRLNGLSVDEAIGVINSSIDAGINFFDHADIYGEFKGISELRFAEAIKNTDIKRENIILQSKCGIRGHSSGNFNYFDFSYEHIISSVEKILKRLETDFLDVFLLHRPDPLMEPEDVAKAFDELEKSGKVRYFGVSNQHPMQIQLLQKTVNQKLIANQLQFSPVFTGMINSGMEVNMETSGAINRDGLILEYTRLNNITVQAWSPYQFGTFDGVFLANDKFKPVNSIIHRIANEYGVSDEAIVAAWILRHPAKIQVVIGSMNPKRISSICEASNLTLSREQWYEIYVAAGNIVP